MSVCVPFYGVAPAAAVSSVNGVSPDIGGDVSLVATDIPTTGPSDVQADLDLLSSSVVTSVKKFESWDEFTSYAVEAPPGTWTFDQALNGVGTIVMPAGAQVIGEGLCAIHTNLVGGLTIIADVDGAAFTGPLSCSNVQFVQSNLGANAAGLCLTGGPAEIPFIDTCRFVGGAYGIRVENITRAAIRGCLTINNVIGSDIRGSIGGLLYQTNTHVSNVAGSIGFQLHQSASVTISLIVQDQSTELVAGQYGFALAHDATFSPGVLLQISGAANTGPQANTFRQTAPGVTDMALSDNRVVIKGAPSEPNWAAVGIASRTDTADPIIVSFGGTNTDTPIPYEDGAGNLEIVASTETHFIWFKDGGDADNSYWEYTGALEGATATLPVDFMHDRASGTGLALIRWQRDAAPGYAGWVAIPDSEATFENTNSKRTRFAEATAPAVSSGDRFRVVAQNSSDTVSLRLQDFRMSPRIQA